MLVRKEREKGSWPRGQDMGERERERERERKKSDRAGEGEPTKSGFSPELEMNRPKGFSKEALSPGGPILQIKRQNVSPPMERIYGG